VIDAQGTIIIQSGAIDPRAAGEVPSTKGTLGN